MKTNKKGFTLVELVIVIAVIAILAAVLLPTFSGIIARAKKNAATQRAGAARDEFVSSYFDSINDINGVTIYVIKGDAAEYVFTVGTNGTLTDASGALPAASATTKTYGDVRIAFGNLTAAAQARVTTPDA